MKMKTLRTLLGVTLGSAVLATGCGSSSAHEREVAKEHCFYAAVQAYPAWTPSKVPVLDGLAECKGISAADKTEMRGMIAQFIAAAATKSQ